MRRNIIFVFLLLLLVSISLRSNSQTNSDMSLKEFFDSKKYRASNVYLGLNYGGFSDSTVFSDKSGADDLAEVNAPLMDAQLVMYETTKDKGYLINFINDALQMMSMRADYMQARLGTYKYKNV